MLCVYIYKINIQRILETYLTMTGKVHVQYHKYQVHRHLCHKHLCCKHFRHVTSWLQGNFTVKDKIMNNKEVH